MKKFIVLFIMLLVVGIAGLANADLIVRGTDSLGNKLIYDTDLDITWYDYSNPMDIWANQVAWADALYISYAGSMITDWRLPTTDESGDKNVGYDGTTVRGYNITSSELGHLFYEGLGGLGYYDTSGNYPQPEYGMQETEYFDNLFSTWYWSGTESTQNPTNAWCFSMDGGYQGDSTMVDSNFYGLAVRDGDVAVPISSTIWLLISGIIAFAGIRRFKE